LGFDFYTIDGVPYWGEDACYRFTDEATGEACVRVGAALLAAASMRMPRRGERGAQEGHLGVIDAPGVRVELMVRRSSGANVARRRQEQSVVGETRTSRRPPRSGVGAQGTDKGFQGLSRHFPPADTCARGRI
jgi:hypothetical protein